MHCVLFPAIKTVVYTDLRSVDQMSLITFISPYFSAQKGRHQFFFIHKHCVSLYLLQRCCCGYFFCRRLSFLLFLSFVVSVISLNIFTCYPSFFLRFFLIRSYSPLFSKAKSSTQSLPSLFLIRFMFLPFLLSFSNYISPISCPSCPSCPDQ